MQGLSLDVAEFNRKRTELTDLLKVQQDRWSQFGVFFGIDVDDPGLTRLKFCRTGATKQIVCVLRDGSEKPMEECSVDLKSKIAGLLPQLEAAFREAYATQQQGVDKAIEQIKLFQSQLVAVDQPRKGE